MQTGYIDLERRFEAVSEAVDSEEFVFQSYAQGREAGSSWSEVLQSPCVVLLGEPGSGKSWEFEAQVERVRRAGGVAFFVRLDVLITQSLRSALTASDLGAFDRWVAGSGDGIFFLDSVDEARVTSRTAFHAALNNFARDLMPALWRVRVAISCRVSEWNWQLDEIEIRRHLRLAPATFERVKSSKQEKAVSDAGEPRIYSLIPLDRKRVTSLAGSLGITDVDSFAKAVDNADAWSFLGRPGDVVDFVGYWKDRGEFGALQQMLEVSVAKRLEESSDRVDGLAPQRARSAVETLAAGVTFCRKYSFQTLDNPRTQLDSIDPRDLLPDWSPQHIRALQQRRIFDGVHFGKIRFHHRNVVEYLTAKWVLALSNAPVREIVGLFFGKVHGREVMFPSRAAVCAWVACGEGIAATKVRELLLKTKPEVFLSKGDPQQLSTEFRSRLLQSLVKRFEGRARVLLQIDRTQLRRIAHADISPTIAGFIGDRRQSPDLRELLLDVATEGKLVSCADAALNILAKGLPEDRDLLFDALELVLAVGDRSQLLKAWEAIDAIAKPSEAICQLAINGLYPSIISISHVTDLLGKIDVAPRGARSLEYGLKRVIREGKFDAELEKLLEGTLEAIQTPPHISKDGLIYPVSVRGVWLDGILYTICTRLLSRVTLDESLTRKLGVALSILSMCKRVDQNYGGKFDLQLATEGHPNVRREYAFHRYATVKKLSPEKIPRLRPLLTSDGIVRPNEVDISWIAPALCDLADSERREWLLKLALEEWQWLGRPWGWLRRLRRSVSDSAVLTATIPDEFAIKLRGLLWWPINYVRFRWWWKLEGIPRRAKELYFEKLLMLKMWVLAGKIRSAEYVGWLRYLIYDREVRGSSNELSDVTKERLIAAYGARIGLAAWEGVKSYWRQTPVGYRRGNEIPIATVLGLAGLAAEVADGIDFRTLDAVLARQAAILATHELNGFPKWFDALSAAHPLVVGEVMKECISRDWIVDASAQNVHEVLAKLRYQTSNVGIQFAPLVREFLIAADPPHPAVLRQAIGIMLKSATCRGTIGELALERVAMYRPDSQQFSTWLNAWLAVNAEPALEYLEKLLSGMPLPESDAVMIGICSMLSDRRDGDMPELSSVSYLSLPGIATLVNLVCKHVRAAEDIDRSNKGVYSPEARDHAQSFRGALFKHIAQLEEPGAYAALQKLAAGAAMAPHRDWILHLMDEKAEADADPAEWLASDVAIFEKTFDSAPRSTNELNRMVLWRLDDLKDEIEDADFPIRNVIDHKAADEFALQVFIARELNGQSRGHYSIEREPEVVGKKKPDIRVKAPKLLPIAIEVKWIDDWSLKALTEALIDQLVGRYLRSSSSRYGVLLLAYRGRRAEWDGLDFEGVVAHLRNLAAGVLNADTAVDGLEIFPMHFAKR